MGAAERLDEWLDKNEVELPMTVREGILYTVLGVDRKNLPKGFGTDQEKVLALILATEFPMLKAPAQEWLATAKVVLNKMRETGVL